MGVFDFAKKQTVVWRDENGKITCPGDSCPKSCDESCPIWCQTLAINAFQTGQDTAALNLFKKALMIAPDFKDAWVNLASVYGHMNNHMEANKAFKTAYAIDNNYKQSILGLIISCKNLGQFDEALEYCEEFASKFGEAEAAKYRDQVVAARESGGVVRQESSFDMVQKIVAHAREIGLLPPNDHLQFIPELYTEAKPVCKKVFDEVVKLKDGQHLWTWLSWGAYAGMGAVLHWHLDWDKLKTKGIAETLLEPRGAFAMDEYVIDAIGIGFESSEGQKLSKDIFNLAMWACLKFIEDPSKRESVKIAFEAMQSMYMFGMAYEMERLGMK